MYGIQVVFNERGYWSKAYTYKSEKAYDKNTVVLVPTNNFYSVGKVISSIENYNFKDDINYKQVLKEIEI